MFSKTELFSTPSPPIINFQKRFQLPGLFPSPRLFKPGGCLNSFVYSLDALQSCAKYIGTTHKTPSPPLTMLKCFQKLILLAIFLTQHCFRGVG